MKGINYIVLLTIIILACCVEKRQQVQIDINSKIKKSGVSGVEQKALDYFVDSLLYQNVSSNFEQVINPLSILDSSMYVQGLFYGKDIYTDKNIYLLSKPYTDTTNYEEQKRYLSDYDIENLKLLYADYWQRINKVDTISINIDERLKNCSLNEFEKKGYYNNALYLQLHRYIKTDTEYYVQIEILDIDFPGSYTSYNFYIVLDSLGVVKKWLF